MTTIKKSKVTLWKTGIMEGVKPPEFLGCVQVISWKWNWKYSPKRHGAEVVLHARDVETMQTLDDLKDVNQVYGRIEDDYCLQLRAVNCGRIDTYDRSVMLAEVSTCNIVDKHFVEPDAFDDGSLTLAITIVGWVKSNWDPVIDYFANKPVSDTTKSIPFKLVPGSVGATDIDWLDKLFGHGRGQE